MSRTLRRFKNEKGLTLVELLAVVVILAIVAAIAFVMIGNVMENAKKDAAIADALQAISAAKLYEVTGKPEGENAEMFPVSIEKLQDDENGYLDKLYDPWTKEEYGKGEGQEVKKDEDGYSVTLNASGCG